MLKQNKFISWLKNPAADTALFIVLLVLLNLVSFRSFLRWDLTRAKSYSLSKASKELVKTLEEPLDIKVFFSNNLPSEYSSVSQYVKDLLAEYKSSSNGNLTCSYPDMDDEESQALARKYGINQVQIQEIANNQVGIKAVYMGIAFTYADQVEKLDNLTSSEGLEYKITQTIGKIISNTNALSGINDPVTVTLFKSDALAGFGISGFDNLEKTVRATFEKVNAKFQNSMTFDIVNPASSEIETLAKKYGIQALEWEDAGAAEHGTIGLVVQAGEKFRVVPLEMVNMIFSYAIGGLDNLEESMTESVKALAAKTTKIAYISNHGELSLQDAQNGAANFAGLLESSYSLEPLDLSKDDIPSGVQSVMINGPKTAFSDAELYKIDQFLLKGGNLMLFIDPFDIQTNPYTGETAYNKTETGLEKILGKYGIKAENAYVCDENCIEQNSRQYGHIYHYYAPRLSDEQLDHKNVITANLGFVTFLLPGELDASEAAKKEDVTVTSLARSSAKSWTLKDNIMLSPFTIVPPADKSTEKSYDLIVLAEGKFDSAFDKKPEDAASATGTDNKSPASLKTLDSESHLTRSVQNGKIFVASTSYITGSQIIQAESEQPVAKLLENAVDYMNGNEALCSMRTKGRNLNTLHVISGPLVTFAKYFNIIGLALIVALIGLSVLVSRNAHRKEIRMRYDADDSREIEK